MSNCSFARRCGWLVALVPMFATAATAIVDNSDTVNFYTLGSWTTSTAGNLTFLGSNHRLATALPAGSIVDNTSPYFSTEGSWSVASTLPNEYGTNYAIAPSQDSSAPLAFPPVVVDNRSYNMSPPRNSFSSSWSSASTPSGYHGRDFVYCDMSTCTNKVGRFNFSIQSMGNLGNAMSAVISAWWPAAANHASNSTIRLSSAAGTTIAQWIVNQQQNGGRWNALGTVQLESIDYYLEFNATGANGRVVADAVKIEAMNSTNSARWRLPNGSMGNHDIYARWPSSSRLETFVGWSVVGGNGSDYPFGSSSQKEDGGIWSKIGTVDLYGSQPNFVQVQQFGHGSSSIVADAVVAVPSRTFPIANWRGPVTSGTVEVRATWSADATRAADAKYIVRGYVRTTTGCYDRTVVASVDQRFAPPSGGYFLGSVPSDSSCAGPKVQLMHDSGQGSLSADAISFTW